MFRDTTLGKCETNKQNLSVTPSWGQQTRLSQRTKASAATDNFPRISTKKKSLRDQQTLRKSANPPSRGDIDDPAAMSSPRWLGMERGMPRCRRGSTTSGRPCQCCGRSHTFLRLVICQPQGRLSDGGSRRGPWRRWTAAGTDRNMHGNCRHSSLEIFSGDTSLKK